MSTASATMHSPALGGSLLASILSEENFRPSEPRSIEETGLTASMIEGMIIKIVSLLGSASGRQMSERLCLPFNLLEPLYSSLRQRQLLVHTGSAQLNDYVYTLTDQGRQRAKQALEACSYVGPAPVPLEDYLVSVDAQSIRAESVRRSHLQKAFADITVDTTLLDQLGPAINSGAGMFLYGAPGNGKTTIAKRITRCFGQHIWVPRTLVDDGQLIKFFDSAYHEVEASASSSLLKTSEHDHRWVKVKRPTVVVGGELTMETLEIRHDPRSNVSEAPLQLKSNCGCLLIDDFGRQRVEPQQLLNRWIVPLENRCDYLTLATGKKITVPFEQLVLFSTNLEPHQLADEAFLRRIPYKIEIKDPSRDEFHLLFKLAAKQFSGEYKAEAVDYLIDRHYLPHGRPLRRCQPRDLMQQVRNLCAYQGQTVEMLGDHFDRVVPTYFTVVK